jgi:CheY-like chemotaxis protein
MDDDVMIRRLLEHMLAKLGYEVVCASDGAEALALYEKARASGQPFGAVLLDLTVPGGMGGKETASRLKEFDPAAKLILSSGYSNDSTIAEFRSHGFDDVLLKPWTPGQLNQTLEHVLKTEPRP